MPDEVSFKYTDQNALSVLANAVEEYRACLAIDRSKLDDAVAEQADLFARVSEVAVRSVSCADRAKLDLSVIEAAAGQRLREASVSAGERVTEAAVKESIDLDAEVRRAKLKLIAWRRAAETWQALRSAVDQRGRMLRDLTQLYASGYFSLSSAGQAEHTRSEERAAAARRAITEKRETDRAKLRPRS